jgi:hypothetical protein
MFFRTKAWHSKVCVSLNVGRVSECLYIVEPGYNDSGLSDTSSVATDILWYQFRTVNRNIILFGYNNTRL